jgi:hypothetical protein
MQATGSSLRLALAVTLLCLASACRADEAPAAEQSARLPELGLMGTIPLYWGEADDFGELLAGEGSAHWARARLEADYRLRPLDTLSDESFAGLEFLLLAQPRALSPAENVALDKWVRGGGRLLLFADPLLTGETRYAIGDRRRPQDVALLSPILSHWRLALHFDDAREPGRTLVATSGAPIPVNLPGGFTLGDDSCALIASDLLASCAIGRGHAVILADAAVLDLYEPDPAAAAALEWLVGESFGKSGESAGNGL